MNKRQIIIIAASAILFVVLYLNVTMNFTILSSFIVLALVAITLLYKTPKKERLQNLEAARIADRIKCFLCVIILGMVGFLTNKTLSNYFFAGQNIYKNSDHHAVRMDGASIINPYNFVVAGESDKALFDNKNYKGTVEICNVDTTGVTLNLKGFTQSIYLNNYSGDELKSAKLLNNACLIEIVPNSWVEFINGRDTCALYISNHFTDGPWYTSRGSAETYYVYHYKHRVDSVAERRMIKRGLDLNTIMGEFVGDNLSFDGVKLLRSTYSTASLNYKQLQQLDDSSSLFIELDRRAYESAMLSEIRIVNDERVVSSHKLSKLKNIDAKVFVPMGRSFTIGCLSDLQSSPIRFVRDTNNVLHFEYVTPKYHNLYTINESGSNTIFLTTSLSQQIIEDNNPPKNIMLFDLFYNENNDCNFSNPHYLSFISGPTTQELDFILDHNKESKIIAGVRFPDIKSKSGDLLWDIEIEDFKLSNPHINENNILIFIVVLGFTCMLCFTIGGNSISGFRIHSLVEIIAYIATLIFFAFRLLLLWRASVFPPAESATIYEFNHFFRSTDAIVFQFIMLNMLFATVLSVKLWIKRVYTKIGSYDLFKILAELVVIYMVMLPLMAFEWHLFDLGRSLGIMTYLIFVVPLIVYVVVWIFWICAYKDGVTCNEKGFANCFRTMLLWMSDSKWFIVFVLLYSVILVILEYLGAKLVSKIGTFGDIMTPLSIYLILEYWIWRYLPALCQGTYDDNGRKDNFTLSDIFKSGLGWSFIVGLATSVVLLLLDGGYGIIFFTFFILTSIIKLYDFLRSFGKYDQSREQRNAHIWRIMMIFVLGILFAVGLIFYKKLMAYLVEWNYMVCTILLSIVLAVVVGIVAYFMGMHPFKGRKAIMSTLVILIMGVGVTVIIKEKVFVNHTLQRVLVHVLPPEQGLAATKNTTDERRFFEASLNDYILNVFNQNAEDVSYIGESGEGYFKLQKHSKVGALWGAQTSDILPARFIIAEHGKELLVLFILIYLIMLFVGIRMRTRYRASKMLLIQIPALLFIHALFVWMANTQAFIFLGQDFPLLSLHSKLSLMYYFVLVAIWVTIASIEKCEVLYREYRALQEEVDNKYYYNTLVSCIYVAGLFIALSLCAIFNTPSRGLTYKTGKSIAQKGGRQNSEKIYSLELLLDSTNYYMGMVDELFRGYQLDSARSLPKTHNLSDVSAVVSMFNGEYDAQIKMILGNEESVHYRLWDKFVNKGGAKNNQSSSLIHVRRKNGLLSFAVRTGYYDMNLPVAKGAEWTGNIVASSDGDINIARVSLSDKYKQYVLPDSWICEGSNITVVKALNRSGVVSSHNENPRFDFAPGYTSAFCRFQGDLFDGSDKLAMWASDTYFARNVMINGRREFIYPMSERFFWAYTFANEVLKQKSSRNRGRKSVDVNDLNADVEITIDQDLTNKIYNHINSAFASRKDKGSDSTYMSVIVADGYGQIRAMVDRKSKYALNPNNRKMVGEIGEQLYMDYNSEINDAYFGNMNLLVMRDGPGSSQKPIVWTAVASALDYDWKNFQMLGFNRKIDGKDINVGLNDKGNNYYTRFFNGERLYTDKRAELKTFKALKSDENRGNGVALADYMTHSSNFYNAVMLYIGGFSQADMSITKSRNPETDAMFVELDKSDVFTSQGYKKPAYDTLFPVFTRKRGNYSSLYKFNRSIPEDYENSILFKQLNAMFGFNTGERFTSIYPGLNLSTESRLRTNSYSFVTNPSFRYNLSTVKGGGGYRREFLMNAIHYAAVGGGSPWQVSPFSMAQIFGQLVTLNKSYKLTLEPVDMDEFEVEIYDNLTKGFIEGRVELLKGMNRVFTKGTATGVGATDKGGMAMIDGYYIYGKTGTANESGVKGDDAHTSLHRLGVVITNKPLEGLSAKELKSIKFYTVYFNARFPYMKYYGDILRTIISSGSFKNYMAEE